VVVDDSHKPHKFFRERLANKLLSKSVLLVPVKEVRATVLSKLLNIVPGVAPESLW